MTDCPRAGKLFGCKFTSRFDIAPPNAEQLRELRGDLLAPLFDDIEAATAKTYIRDVCQRCGKTVERVKA